MGGSAGLLIDCHEIVLGRKETLRHEPLNSSLRKSAMKYLRSSFEEMISARQEIIRKANYLGIQS